MKEKPKFEKSLTIMRFALLLSGIKTQESNSNSLIDIFIDKYLYYVNVIILNTVLLGEIYWIIHGMWTGEKFIDLSYCLPLIVISVVSTFKCFFLFNKNDKVRFLINTLKEIHPENEETEFGNKELGIDGDLNEIKEEMDEVTKTTVTETEIVKETVTMLSTIINFLMVISTGVLIMFCLAPVIMMFVKYLMAGEFVIMYPYVVRYWFDIHDTEYWPVLYIHQVIATGIVCANLFGTELLFYVLCSYIEMHFRILGSKFVEISSWSQDSISEEIVRTVRKQQLLISLVNLGETLYSKSALMHMVTSSFLICLSAFNITVAKDINTLFAFVMFLVLSLSQVSLLCFFGDKLMESSVALSGAVYQCPWYDFTSSTKKDVFILIIRSQKPCKLTAANFADLNLRAFTTILSRSWSYFALLKTMYSSSE